jgi:methanogen homocitrate synthase
MGLSAEIVGFCRSVKDDVQKAFDAGCKAIVMEIMAFPRGLQALGWSFEEATGKMIEVSHFAKSKGLRVTVFFVCVLQAPLDFSKKFIQKVLAEGVADGVCIPDTFGTCMPNTIYHYVRKLREWTDKPIEIHPHNMYSLGAADALAGVMAGAEVVHVCVNGLGEGAGNAPLEAVALDLPLMLGIDTGVRLSGGGMPLPCPIQFNITVKWQGTFSAKFPGQSGTAAKFPRRRQIILPKGSGRCRSNWICQEATRRRASTRAPTKRR